MGAVIAARSAGSDRKRRYSLPLLTLGTRCNAWRDCCAEIMTSKCCIEHLKRDGRKPGSGERCCSKNAMHVSGPPLLVLDCFHRSFYWSEKSILKTMLARRHFLNLHRHNESIKLAIPKSRKTLRNCSLNLKHFDQNGNLFYLRSNCTFRIKMLSSEGRRHLSWVRKRRIASWKR